MVKARMLLTIGVIFIFQTVVFGSDKELLIKPKTNMPIWQGNGLRKLATVPSATQFVELTGIVKVNDSAGGGGSGSQMSGPPIYLQTDNGTYVIQNPTGYYADPLWQTLIPLKDKKVTLIAEIASIAPQSGYNGSLVNVKDITTETVAEPVGITPDVGVSFNKKDAIGIAVTMARIFFDGKYDLRYDLNNDNKVDKADIAVSAVKFFGGNISQTAEDKIKLILMGDVKITSPVGTAGLTENLTEVKNDHILVKTSGFDTEFGNTGPLTYDLNLTIGALTFQGRSAPIIITPNDVSYSPAINGMLSTINNQIGDETNISNKEKLQTAANFLSSILSNILLKRIGLEEMNIVTASEEISLGGGITGRLTVTMGVNKNEILAEQKIKGDPAQITNGETLMGWKLNLFTEEFTYTSSVFGDQVVTPNNKESYLNGIDALRTMITGNLNNVVDASDRDKLQKVINFLNSR